MRKINTKKQNLKIISFFKAILLFLRGMTLRNTTLFRVIQISLISIAFLDSPSFSQNQVEKPERYEDVKKGVGSNVTGSNRIKEYGGEIIVDGSMRVLEQTYGKTFDLVEISTPVTPAANHARLFLRADGTKQSLVILYDDGTTDTIATNQ